MPYFCSATQSEGAGGNVWLGLLFRFRGGADVHTTSRCDGNVKKDIFAD